MPMGLGWPLHSQTVPRLTHPTLPFPKVSETRLHGPWSWTSLLLSIAAASWVSLHQSRPHPGPAETRHLGPGPPWGAQGPRPPGADGGSPLSHAPVCLPTHLGPDIPPRPVPPTVAAPESPGLSAGVLPHAAGYLPVRSIIAGLLLGGEALVLLLGVVVCGTSTRKGQHLEVLSGVLAMRPRPTDSSPLLPGAGGDSLAAWAEV